MLTHASRPGPWHGNIDFRVRPFRCDASRVHADQAGQLRQPLARAEVRASANSADGGPLARMANEGAGNWARAVSTFGSAPMDAAWFSVKPVTEKRNIATRETAALTQCHVCNCFIQNCRDDLCRLLWVNRAEFGCRALPVALLAGGTSGILSVDFGRSTTSKKHLRRLRFCYERFAYPINANDMQERKDLGIFARTVWRADRPCLRHFDGKLI